MSIHLLVNPPNVKETILNSLMIRVTIYKTTAEDTHLNKPKVIKFIGKSSKLITGLARRNTPISAIPVTNKVAKPLSKTIPFAILDTTHKEKVSITKWRRMRFIC